mmetsp:Transcript_37515/g.54894  ORF Transcript_37515/g.54894 Transcript_37515/m.54894 type:complete len:88 (+) Transcript_37515:107-370(+)
MQTVPSISLVPLHLPDITIVCPPILHGRKSRTSFAAGRTTRSSAVAALGKFHEEPPGLSPWRRKEQKGSAFAADDGWEGGAAHGLHE